MRPDPRYVAARRVLLDALEALDEHRDAIVVVGAQAVYLRTGAANVGVAEYTTDGDLALDAARLAPTPLLGAAMGERFDRGKNAAGIEEPGVWVQQVQVDGEDIEITVDLIVPEALAPAGGSRGARLGPHGKRAARKASGLEAAVVDNDVLAIEALDPDDGRRIACAVAGPTALLIAKAHKIGDRLAESARPDRLVDNVYKAQLDPALQAQTPTALARLISRDIKGQFASFWAIQRALLLVARLLADERVAGPSRRGLDLLRAQFGARRAPGVEMAVRSLRVGVPEDRVRAVCVRFLDALRVG